MPQANLALTKQVLITETQRKLLCLSYLVLLLHIMLVIAIESGLQQLQPMHAYLQGRRDEAEEGGGGVP